MGSDSITTVAFAVLAIGGILLVVAVPALCLALMRGHVRGGLRIAAVIAVLASLILVAALVLGSSPPVFLTG